MDNLRILFVGMYPDVVNPYRNVFFQNLIHATADAGVECTVISPIPVTKYGIKTHRIPRHTTDVTAHGSVINVYYPRYISLSSKRIGPIHTGIWSEQLFQRCAMKQAEKLCFEADVVYGHFFLAGGLSAIKIARKRKIPAFIAYGECNYETEVCALYRELNKEDIDGLSGIIAVSTSNANVLKEKNIFEGIPMIIAPNAVDMQLFYKRDKEICRDTLGIPKDAFVVGFVGGFIERKGDKRLLEAVENIDGVYVAFAGKGTEPPNGEKVVFCQSLPHDLVPVLLNAVDIFCLPTLNEGSCNALVEAAACGVPIISSDLPFNDDLLNDDNSIRIDPNSVTEIRNAILELYKDKAFRERIAKQAYEDAQEFNICNRCDRILRFIANIRKLYLKVQ